MALVRGLVTLLLAETALLMLIILTWNTTELLGNTNPNQSKQYARKIRLLRSLTYQIIRDDVLTNLHA